MAAHITLPVWGGVALHDVATKRHAEKALAAGAAEVLATSALDGFPAKTMRSCLAEVRKPKYANLKVVFINE